MRIMHRFEFYLHVLFSRLQKVWIDRVFLSSKLVYVGCIGWKSGSVLLFFFDLRGRRQSLRLARAVNMLPLVLMKEAWRVRVSALVAGLVIDYVFDHCVQSPLMLMPWLFLKYGLVSCLVTRGSLLSIHTI